MVPLVIVRYCFALSLNLELQLTKWWVGFYMILNNTMHKAQSNYSFKKIPLSTFFANKIFLATAQHDHITRSLTQNYNFTLCFVVWLSPWYVGIFLKLWSFKKTICNSDCFCFNQKVAALLWNFYKKRKRYLVHRPGGHSPNHKRPFKYTNWGVGGQQKHNMKIYSQNYNFHSALIRAPILLIFLLIRFYQFQDIS